jgi:hypothetical protein
MQRIGATEPEASLTSWRYPETLNDPPKETTHRGVIINNADMIRNGGLAIKNAKIIPLKWASNTSLATIPSTVTRDVDINQHLGIKHIVQQL